jgi:carbonic anhydrase
MIARNRAVLVAVVLLTSSLVAATDPPTTPAVALGQLKAGNDRFVRNVSKPVSLSAVRRKELAAEQHPIAMVLSCADSRVPPEHVFNAGLGELFVIRTAGEVIDRSILATVEYGAEHLHIPLLVVMGHESCGAVKAAADSAAPPESENLGYLVKAIQAARRPSGEGLQQTAADRDAITTLVLDNVEQVINDALTRSPLIKRMVTEGGLSVVGAYYELVSGRVVFSEPLAGGPTISTATQAVKPQTVR